MENKRSFKSNDKYKLSIICESKCFKGKTFAQISPLLVEKYKKERREALMENGRTRKPSTINRELGILSKIFSLAIKYGITHSNPCRDIPWLPENNERVRYLSDEEEPKLFDPQWSPQAFTTFNNRRYRHGNEARRSIEFAMGESRFPA